MTKKKKIENPSGRGGYRPGSGRRKSGYTFKAKSIPAELEEHINDYIQFLKDIHSKGMFEISEKFQFKFTKTKKVVSVSTTRGKKEKSEKKKNVGSFVEVAAEDIYNMAKSAGSSFVRVHQIREKLKKYERSIFDEALKLLASQQKVEFTGGDNSKFTKQEMADSYVNSRGNIKVLMVVR